MNVMFADEEKALSASTAKTVGTLDVTITVGDEGEGDNDNDNDNDNDSISIYSDEASLDSAALFAADEDEISKNQNLADKLPANEGDEWLEEGIVEASKLIHGIIALLCLGALVITAVTLYSARGRANQEYEIAFEDVSKDILDVTRERSQSIQSILRSLSRTITTASMQNQNQNQHPTRWPFYTLESLRDVAQDFIQLDNASLIYSPLVSDLDRPAWEYYAVHNQHKVTLNKNYPYQIPPYIYNRDNHTADIAHNGTGPFSPAWHILPLPDSYQTTSRVNYNILSNNRLKHIIEASYKSKQVVTSELQFTSELVGERLWQSGGKLQAQRPQSLIVQPVFDSFNQSTRQIVAHVFATVPWDIHFLDIIIPETQSRASVFLVLTNSCGNEYTYFADQTGVTLLGEGDRHIPEYEDIGQQYVLSSFGGYNAPDNLHIDNRTQMGAAWTCSLTLSVYPTGRMKWYYSSDTTVTHLLALVFFVFVLVGALTLTHHRVTDAHQRDTQAQAKRSKAIIASLFPEAVREKLFDVEGEVNVDKLGLFNSEVQKAVKSPGGDNPEIEDLWGKRDKYADLYPNCTVCIADISGFSAWSASRDPSEIFTLLEAVFSTFDKIATRRGAYKVETVGDTYIAAAGLPKQRDDHATVMAHFARDALDEFIEVSNKLEVTLGPDTSDLGVRLALASGPVLAGVVRGERARFQIFGMTVSRCAELEQEGQADRIHISKETADLIRDAGHGAWVRHRSRHGNTDVDSETYWLLPKRSLGFFQSKASTFRNSLVDGSSATFHTRRSNTAPAPADNRIFEASMSELHRVPITELLDASNSTLSKKNTNTKASTRGRRMSATLLSPAARRSQSSADKVERLVFWNSEALLQVLRLVVGKREASKKPRLRMDEISKLEEELGTTRSVISEFQEPIEMPCHNNGKGYSEVELGTKIESQMFDFVTIISTLYRRTNPYSNFERASHVTMTMQKLLPRLADPNNGSIRSTQRATGTDRIRNHPLTQFALMLATLICDVDHRGVSNQDLSRENAFMADLYNHRSVNQQNALEMSWQALMDPSFRDLRRCIYSNEAEIRHFRSVLAHAVLATDLMGGQEDMQRHWKEAFEIAGVATNDSVMQYRVTAVIEHIMQLVSLSEYTQHWHVYCKWSQKRFLEKYMAFREGRTQENPADGWYQAELDKFESQVIPLARKLQDSEVFGTWNSDYLRCALSNRKEWEAKGKEILGLVIQKYSMEYQSNQLGESSVGLSMDNSRSNHQREISESFTQERRRGGRIMDFNGRGSMGRHRNAPQVMRASTGAQPRNEHSRKTEVRNESAPDRTAQGQNDHLAKQHPLQLNYSSDSPKSPATMMKQSGFLSLLVFWHLIFASVVSASDDVADENKLDFMRLPPPKEEVVEDTSSMDHIDGWTEPGQLRRRAQADSFFPADDPYWNPFGVMERKRCVPFENLRDDQKTNALVDQDCVTGGGQCGGGGSCCRAYFWLRCDGDSSFAYVPCVCASNTWPSEAWTRAPTPTIPTPFPTPFPSPMPTPNPTFPPTEPPTMLSATPGPTPAAAAPGNTTRW
ncbi:cyclase soluble subunit alpha-3 [Seminavis robusta]|uniref:Cyclase soluble subunit alpha-3 n=1 Tax=Seminavis robusta TaxID=568900 RepID=A0A9N8D6Q6_9STRA|nr:cyclase soluble subunit alpha-3 [Seminavis robusta]|eukprot:Sro3_g002050.1 cyclase soluble subunit alpha-3 (1557) ;mRNA; r:30337-35847